MSQTHQSNNRPEKSSSNQCGLLELPNELLLPVFKDLPEEGLLSLAYLSRRLHLLAMPLYLGRIGILEDLDKCSSYNVVLNSTTFSSLLMLRKSLCITSIAHLLCRFPSSDESVLNEVREIHRLVSGLTTVSEATLDFSHFYSCNSAIPLKVWITAFRDLLKVLSNKSCTSLTICYGDHPAAAFIRHPSVDNKRLTVPLAHSFRKLFTNSKDVSNTLVIAGSILPLHVLNGSSITTLTLEYMRLLSYQEWATILSATTLPALAKLRISSCPIALADLSIFLSRHPSITTLDLSYLEPAPGQARATSPRKSILPRLTSLTVDVDVAPLLLPAELPSLESISVPLRLTYTKHRSQLGDVDIAFAGIADRSTAAAADATSIKSSSSKATKLQVHLDISMDFDVEDAVLIAREANTAENKIERWHYLVRSISFNSSVRYPGLTKNKLKFLPIWLRRWFPAIQQVSIGHHCHGPCVTTCEYHRLTAEDRTTFTSSIRKNCPSVETMIVNGNIHPL